MNAAGKPLDADVERMIGEEIGSTDPILAVGIFGDSRYELCRPFGRNDRELHLNKRPREIELSGVSRHESRLSSVRRSRSGSCGGHGSSNLPSDILDIDLFSRGSYPVVVGEEH